MDVAGYYRALSSKRDEICEIGIEDEEAFAKHITSHNFLKELASVKDVMPDESGTVLAQGCREFHFALEAVLRGNYRHAFASLRLFLELSFGAYYYSAHLLKLRLWLSGSEDLVWGTIIDPDKGLLSHNFLRGFFPELGPLRTQYLGLANTVYRECSEYVHGNPATHEVASAEIAYDRDKVFDFHDKAETIRICLIFAFSMRFLKNLSKEQLASVEGVVIDVLGNVPEIQAVFDEAKA